MFQQSAESSLYAILTAQARTRLAIVGQGAKSLQTQEVFRTLVQNTVVGSDNKTLINNMRQAIDDTNVVLNAAIVPGVILVPSRMIILVQKIPGFNNTLTLANTTMKFKVNTTMNYDPESVSVNPAQI